jgi:phage shock protein PspC (stress-responsive transcriptional regulator)
MTRRFELKRSDAKLTGVAAGLAELIGVDALIIRLSLILAVLVTGPIAMILYLAAWLLAPNR